MLTESELLKIFKSSLFVPLGVSYELGQPSPNLGREWSQIPQPPKAFKIAKESNK